MLCNEQFTVPRYKDLLRYFFIIVLLYLYLFQPPLISKYIFITFEITIILFYALFINRNFIQKFVTLFPKESIIITSILSFCLLRDLMAGEEVYSFRMFAWSFQSFIFGFFIIYLTNNYNRKRNKHVDLFHLFYWTAFIASVITLLLLINPGFDTFYRSFQIEDFDRYDSFEIRYRAYGISENLTFTYSYVLGFFGGYTLFVLRKNFLLTIPFFLFLLSVMLNARIGFFAILLCLFYLVFYLKDIKPIFISGIAGLAIILILSFYFSDIIELLTLNKDWVLEFFYEISDFVFGTNFSMTASGTVNTLTTNFIILPDNFFQWILGRGESLFLKHGMNSDIGFILQLNYGGLIYLILLMSLMTVLFYRLYQNLGLGHWFFIFFFFSFFILNTKGFIFAATPGGRLFFLFYLYFILKGKTYII